MSSPSPSLHYQQFQGDAMAATGIRNLIRYPAAERNKGPILEVLKRVLTLNNIDNSGPQRLKALEIGSGSGQHVAHFASALACIDFQPSDLDGQLFDNIVAFREQYKLDNILDPVSVNLIEPADQWPIPSGHYDLMCCSNVLHISPFETSIGLFAGASRCLKPETGVLLVYGPFAVDGDLTPESNVTFDRSLRERNAAWGIRDTRKLSELAQTNGLRLRKIFDMPANNKVLLFDFGGK